MRRRAVFTSCHFWLSTAEEMLSSIVSQQVGKMRQGGGGGATSIQMQIQRHYASPWPSVSLNKPVTPCK